MLFKRRRKSLWWDKRANIAFGSHKFPQLRFACVIYWFCGFILSCTDTQTWLQFSNKLFSPSNSRRCLYLERFSFIYVLIASAVCDVGNIYQSRLSLFWGHNSEPFFDPTLADLEANLVIFPHLNQNFGSSSQIIVIFTLS